MERNVARKICAEGVTMDVSLDYFLNNIAGNRSS